MSVDRFQLGRENTKKSFRRTHTERDGPNQRSFTPKEPRLAEGRPRSRMRGTMQSSRCDLAWNRTRAAVNFFFARQAETRRSEPVVKTFVSEELEHSDRRSCCSMHGAAPGTSWVPAPGSARAARSKPRFNKSVLDFGPKRFWP